MIIEQGIFTITPGREAAFEEAYEKARQVIARAPGFQSVRLSRGIEHPSTYLLLVAWDTLEAHMDGFRESPLFLEWRGHIGSYFAEAPVVQHFEPVP